VCTVPLRESSSPQPLQRRGRAVKRPTAERWLCFMTTCQRPLPAVGRHCRSPTSSWWEAIQVLSSFSSWGLCSSDHWQLREGNTCYFLLKLGKEREITAVASWENFTNGKNGISYTSEPRAENGDTQPGDGDFEISLTDTDSGLAPFELRIR
jgi:hypothetical protein